MDEIVSFASWLKARRRVLDLTQAELAGRVGCATAMIKKIEQDERRPSKEIAIRLAQALELPAAEHTAFVRSARGQLAADQLAIVGLPVELPPLQTLHAPPGAPKANLPLQLTSFIGREQELATLHQRLLDPQVRLLTLTGPGGSGKTRLALAVAEQLVESFRDGVTFVALAPLSDPELVLPTIAQTLGLRESSGQTLRESLTYILRSQERLLLLDNFEQVLAAATDVATLLAAAPGLKVLVTSRSVLHLVGEHDVPVQPLALPDPQHLPDLDDLSQCEAVALFIQQACAVNPDFRLTRANAPAVAEICARLDGLPLAIELAAARSTLLTPQALARRLDHRLTLLTGGARDRPARHQTLRVAIDWSYDLLEGEEQALFRRLGVFVGSWTVEATEVVCSSDDSRLESLDGLQALLDTSLIRQTEGPEGEPRLTMLETVREYALEQLAANGETEALRQQHAAYYLLLSETAAPKLRGPDQATWLARLEREHNNVRAVLAWSLAGAPGGEQATIGLRLAVAVWDFWARQGFGREGKRWFADLLARSEVNPAGSEARLLRARALLAAGNLALYRGDAHVAQPLLDESQALFQALGDTWGTAYVLQSLGLIANEQGNPQRAISLMEQSLALFRALGDRWAIGCTLLFLAFPQLDMAGSGDTQDNRSRACELLEESLAHIRHVGDVYVIASTLVLLGSVVGKQGDGRRARVLLEEALRLADEIGNKQQIVHALMGFAELAAQGRGAEAERAARLTGAAQAVISVIGSDQMNWGHQAASRLAGLRAQLGDARFAAAWAEGQVMMLEHAVAYALSDES